MARRWDNATTFPQMTQFMGTALAGTQYVMCCVWHLVWLSIGPGVVGA